MPDHPFYNSPQWRAERATKLAANPICEVPGCGQRASYVDHIRAIKNGGALCNRADLVSLDHGCPWRKTVAVDSGFGRPTTMALLGRKGCDANGLPVDPNHSWRR